MKTLRAVLIMLPDLDGSLNVMNVAGRSGVEYAFSYDADRRAHVRAYTGFDDPQGIARLNGEDADISDGILPPGWVLRREYQFEEVENALLDEAVDLVRRLELRLIANINPRAAEETYSEDQMALLKQPLSEPVMRFLKDRGVESAYPDWDGVHQKMKAERDGVVEAEKEAGAPETKAYAPGCGRSGRRRKE